MTSPRSPEAGPPAPADGAGAFEVSLTLDEGYRFHVNPEMEGAEGFTIDESPPLGSGKFATPARVLASAMASCLASSFLHCARKSRIDVLGLRVAAKGTFVRNARNRLRIGAIHIELFPEVAAGDEARMQRCLELFEDFCVVTESVRGGIPVVVGVETRHT
ncbi:MAG: OsmC family protein [Gemmatimonadota bacterium]